MGREAKINKKLTGKQLAFVKRIVEGQSATQAVLATYNTKDKRVAASIAHENLNKPDIKEALEEALSSQGLSLSTIVSNIGDLARSKPEKISAETKLKANIELLKLMGAYPDKRSTPTSSYYSKIQSLTYDEAKMQLKQLEVEMNELVADIER